MTPRPSPSDRPSAAGTRKGEMGKDRRRPGGKAVEPVEGEEAADHQRAHGGRPQIPAGPHSLLEKADQVRSTFNSSTIHTKLKTAIRPVFGFQTFLSPVLKVWWQWLPYPATYIPVLNILYECPQTFPLNQMKTTCSTWNIFGNSKAVRVMSPRFPRQCSNFGSRSLQQNHIEQCENWKIPITQMVNWTKVDLLKSELNRNILNKVQLTKLAIAQLAHLTNTNYQLFTQWSTEQGPTEQYYPHPH